MKKSILLTAFVSLGAISQGHAALVSGLVNYYSMNGNANDTAGTYAGSASTNADNGTVRAGGANAGTVAFTNSGSASSSQVNSGFGNYAFFPNTNTYNDAAGADVNDSTYITIPNGTDIDFTGKNLTISLWLHAADSFGGNWQSAISKGEGSDYRIARLNNTHGVGYAGGNADIAASIAAPVGSGTVNPDLNGPTGTDWGTWYHIVATTEHNVGTTLWVNGVQVAQRALATTAINATSGTGNQILNSDLWIGGNPEAGGAGGGLQPRSWRGGIDDIGMWDRVLTSAEIGSIYSTGAAGSELSTLLVPEPSASLLLGVIGMLAIARRRR